MPKYSIGLDYGTLSCRAVLVDVSTGQEVATAVLDYPHSVMVQYLPDGKTKLGHDWALQHPQDYLDALAYVVPEVLKLSGASPDDIIGLGVDFTSCTILSIDEDGTPLCLLEKWKDEPHAWVKLWKHHAAQHEADKLNEIAEKRGEEFLKKYGGKISSEWMIPKVWQILNEAPEIYDATYQFLDAGDWIVQQLTGNINHNSCASGFKHTWLKNLGYPSKGFLKTLHPRLETFIEEKLNAPIISIGAKAGELTEKAAKMIGLKPGIAVAAAIIDAHSALLAVGISEPGMLLAIMGTSTCHIMLDEKEHIVPGTCVVEDGVLPGYFAYEAGQGCVGDHFKWLVDNCVPESYAKEASEKGLSIYQLLSDKASHLSPGESALLALDWWNGQRTPLVDANLTGLILGMTLATKPEEIYRTLVEATAYGTRKIVETFRENGVQIHEFYSCGGLANNPLVTQIYSDVLNMPIKIADSLQTSALGAAMVGALAAGKERGGFDDISEVTRVMGRVKEEPYRPNLEHVQVYDELYGEYKRLFDYFGRGGNNVMMNLKNIKKQSQTRLAN